MINEWNVLSQLQNGKNVYQEINGLVSTSNTQIPMNNELVSLLAKLQIGDLLEGTLLNKEGSYILDMGKQMKLPVQVLHPVQIGQQLTFEVIDKQAQKLVLKLFGAMDSEESLAQKTTKALKLPDSPEIKELIEAFAQKQLPFDKSQLLKASYMQKNYGTPIETLVNLIAHDGQLEEKELSQLSQFKKDSMQGLEDQFQEIGSQTKFKEESVSLFKALADTYEQKTELASVLKDTLNEMVGTSKSQEIFSDETNGLVNEKEIPINQQEIKNKIEYDLTKILNAVEDFSKENIDRLNEKLIKHYFEHHIRKSDLLNSTQKTLTEDHRIEGWHEVSKRLAHLTEKLNEAKLGTKSLETLHEVENQIDILRRYEITGQYYLVPLYKGQKEAGEVYFFKPKKSKGKNKDQLYIVVALDMPHLQHIEVHIQKSANQLNVVMKVKEAAMKKVIDEKMETLKTLITEAGFEAGLLGVQLMQEKSKKIFEEKASLYHMDLKV